MIKLTYQLGNRFNTNENKMKKPEIIDTTPLCETQKLKIEGFIQASVWRLTLPVVCGGQKPESHRD